jgi:signal transduction histidine kinase
VQGRLEHPVEITTGVLRRDDGRPDGGMAVLVDVTERRLLEARCGTRPSTTR